MKIDRSFVSHLEYNSDDASIVTAVICLGHSLKIGVIAEGVETAAQLDFLRRAGCDEMQGYLFSRQVSAAVVTRVRKDRR